jgi:hypothetical protein
VSLNDPFWYTYAAMGSQVACISKVSINLTTTNKGITVCIAGLCLQDRRTVQKLSFLLLILTAVLLPLLASAAAMLLQWPPQQKLAVCGSSHHLVAPQPHLQRQPRQQQGAQQQAAVPQHQREPQV